VKQLKCCYVSFVFGYVTEPKICSKILLKVQKRFVNTNPNQQTHFVDKIRIVSVFSSSSAVNNLMQPNAERFQ